jgi:hypothetical protein
MVIVEKKENRTHGDRLPIGEVKAGIISYILSKDDAVPASDLFKYLGEKYGIRNKKNIRNHLEDLKNDHCIEKIDPVRDGFENKWNITKREHLKNIKKKTETENCFKEIKLSTYEKAVNITRDEISPRIGPMGQKEYFILLALSDSYFTECLIADIDKLYAQAFELYLLGKDKNEERKIEIKELYIQNLINEVYTKSIRRIQKNPKYYSDIEISNELFTEILESIPFPWEKVSCGTEVEAIVKELSVKLSGEIVSQMLKEMPEEMITKISEEIFKKLMEGSSEILSEKISEIINLQNLRRIDVFDRIFEYFYHIDVYTRTTSSEEREFFHKNRDCNFISENNPLTRIECINKLYNDYYEICRGKMKIQS